MGEQMDLVEDERGELLERLEDYEAFFTPVPVAQQAAKRVIDPLMGDDWTRKPRILDPSAGSGSYGLAIRRLYGSKVELVSIEPREEERENLLRLSDDVFSGLLQDYLSTSPEPFDVIIGNPPFSLVYHFVRWSFDYGLTKNVVVLLALSSLGQSGAGAKAFRLHRPMEQWRIQGRIGFRGPGVNPKTGKKWGVDQRDYSHWLWSGAGGKVPRGMPVSWLTTNLPELPTSQRTWTVRPGTEPI